eukprot:382402-Pelagomonas_calceolata.AAC.1
MARQSFQHPHTAPSFVQPHGVWRDHAVTHEWVPGSNMHHPLIKMAVLGDAVMYEGALVIRHQASSLGGNILALQAVKRLRRSGMHLTRQCAAPNAPAAAIMLQVLPQQYIASNWPVVHVAVSSSGIDMAVAGQRGLALYSRLTDR